MIHDDLILPVELPIKTCQLENLRPMTMEHYRGNAESEWFIQEVPDKIKELVYKRLFHLREEMTDTLSEYAFIHALLIAGNGLEYSMGPLGATFRWSGARGSQVKAVGPFLLLVLLRRPDGRATVSRYRLREGMDE